MNKLTFSEMTSYAGAIAAFLASLIGSMSLAEWSVLAGIVTALVTCASNLAYMRRKDAREQHQAELAEREALARLERGQK